MQTFDAPRIRELLLAKGYFSPRIPHIFNSGAFAAQSHDLFREWQGKSGPATRAERYNAARDGLRRREMQIPNPVNQLYVANLIAENWDEIWRHNGASQISESKCEIDEKHGIHMTPHEELREKRQREMAGYSHILKTDINRFFPSIYTHKIEKALLHGEEKTSKLGKDMDKLVGMCNGTQTVGIPIGPCTSHIIAEIIMSAIDREVENKLGPLKGYRHVDDYFLCFNSHTEAEEALAAIQKAAAAYELAVNDTKTEILQNTDHTESPWVTPLQMMNAYRKEKEKREGLAQFTQSFFRTVEQHIISQNHFAGLLMGIPRALLPLEESDKQKEHKKWLLQFASEAFALAKKYPGDSVMKYALGILGRLPLTGMDDARDEQENLFNEDIALAISARLDNENWKLYESILIRIMTTYPYTLSKVAQILRCCRDYYELDRDKLSGVVSSLICKHAPLEHHSEVAWALWLAKALKLNIEDAGEHLPAVQSGVCALLALDNMNAGLVRGVTPSDWKKDFSEQGLKSRRWLLAYEAPRKGWSGEKSAGYIEHDKFFAALHSRDVSFYNEKDDRPPPSAIFFY